MAINLNDNLSVLAPKSVDERYGPFGSVEEALLNIPSSFRHLGLTVGIAEFGEVREYWFKFGTADEDLVVKTTSLWSESEAGIYNTGNVSIGTEESRESLTIDGRVDLNNLSVYGSDFLEGPFDEGSFVVLQDILSAEEFRSVKYWVQVEGTSGPSQVTEVVAVHDNTELFYTLAGNLWTGDELCIFDAYLDGTTIVLSASPLTPSIRRFTLKYEAIRSIVPTPDPVQVASFVATWKNCSSLQSLNIIQFD